MAYSHVGEMQARGLIEGQYKDGDDSTMPMLVICTQLCNNETTYSSTDEYHGEDHVKKPRERETSRHKFFFVRWSLL